jgi:uncharacterized protein with PIN domain
MIIDTSVASAIESAGERRISATGYLEAALVIDNRGDAVARASLIASLSERVLLSSR